MGRFVSNVWLPAIGAALCIARSIAKAMSAATSITGVRTTLRMKKPAKSLTRNEQRKVNQNGRVLQCREDLSLLEAVDVARRGRLPANSASKNRDAKGTRVRPIRVSCQQSIQLNERLTSYDLVLPVPFCCRVPLVSLTKWAMDFET